MNNEGSNKRKPLHELSPYDREQGSKSSLSRNEGHPSEMNIDNDVYADIPDRSHHQRQSHSLNLPHRRPSEPFESPHRGCSLMFSNGSFAEIPAMHICLPSAAQMAKIVHIFHIFHIFL